MEKTGYSVKTGLWKSVQNWAVVMGIPMVVVLADNYTSWLPEGYALKAAPIIAFISYFVKNYLKNKDI